MNTTFNYYAKYNFFLVFDIKFIRNTKFYLSQINNNRYRYRNSRGRRKHRNHPLLQAAFLSTPS